jgi:hypothetical protein
MNCGHGNQAASSTSSNDYEADAVHASLPGFT